eukprot:2787809-Amphidinium_carterae.1
MFGLLWTTDVTDAGYYWYFYNSVTRNDPTEPDARQCEHTPEPDVHKQNLNSSIKGVFIAIVGDGIVISKLQGFQNGMDREWHR